MLQTWLWWMRLRRVPASAAKLQVSRNWMAFVGRFGLSGLRAEQIATAHNFALDQNGYRFGALYEAKEDIFVGPFPGPLKRGQRYLFAGYGALPHDGIMDYYFEDMDGAAHSLTFETLRGSDVAASHAKLLNDRLLVPLSFGAGDSGAGNTKRARELQIVRTLLARLRRRNRV